MVQAQAIPLLHQRCLAHRCDMAPGGRRSHHQVVAPLEEAQHGAGHDEAGE